MKNELNENFIPIVNENFKSVNGQAHKKAQTLSQQRRKRAKNRAVGFGLAFLALLSLGIGSTTDLGHQIIYGLKIEKIVNDAYHEDAEIEKLLLDLGYCYDAGTGVPGLNYITNPFEFGSPDCEEENCNVCKKNKETSEEIDEKLSEKYPEYVEAKDEYNKAIEGRNK